MSGTGNISRRHLLQGGAVLGLSIGMPVAAWAGRPHVAGFEPEPWFIESSGDLATDAAEAGADGKYLALLWEQRGCHYCEELHRVNFRDADVIALGKNIFVPFRWIFGESASFWIPMAKNGPRRR